MAKRLDYTPALCYTLGQFLKANANGEKPSDDDTTRAIRLLIRLDALPKLPEAMDQRIAYIQSQIERDG